MAMTPGMNPVILRRALAVPEDADPDGPALLVPEIVSLLVAANGPVWLPFRASRILASLGQVVLGDIVVPDDVWRAGDKLPSLAAVYFGVPTIVDNKALFGAAAWNTDNARTAARLITAMALDAGVKLIVSGLGSGDITVADRISDMGGGQVMVMKHFGTFQDWVIARWL